MRPFDSAMMSALSGIVTNLALALKITRRDGAVISFAQMQDPIIIGGVEFVPAAGVLISTIPFELNGGSVRIDLYAVSTDGGTIDANDVRNGLYDNAQVTIYVINRAASDNTLQNVLFTGLMGPITVTERGYCTIELVGLLERAKQFLSEVYTPVCRADFGDARCKVDLAPLTQRVIVADYDGAYNIEVDGLSGPSSGKGTNASGEFIFYGNPANGQWIGICGTNVGFYSGIAPGGLYIQVPIGATPFETLNNLISALITSYDPNIDLCTYEIDPTRSRLVVIANAQGTVGNSYPIISGASGIVTSGPKLTGGAGLGNFFVNGQIIFRSGLLINQAYEIQASQGATISLFTPLDFAPQTGDQIDIIQGCDHSPFAGGCLQYVNPETGRAPNILNYRGEPYCFGQAYTDYSYQGSPPPPTGPGGGGGVPPNIPGTADDNPPGLWPPYFDVSGA